MDADKKRSREDPRNVDSRKRDVAPVYKIFYTIDQAWSFSIKNGLLPLFALDKVTPKNPGSKIFVVASYERFYNKYVSMKPESRCFYETILPDLPCHLHVDAEFNRERNPNRDASWMDSTFRKECLVFMMELEIISNMSDVKILVLDSSNEKKVSKHYMFLIRDGTRFKNNYHCGAFIRRLKNRMLNKYGDDKDNNPFFVWSVRKNKDEESDPEKSLDFFGDVCIYTLRRQWRLWGSTKRLGPYRPLLLEGDDKNAWKLSKEKFYETLIQRIGDYSALKIATCLEENGEEPISSSRKREKKDAHMATRLKYPSQKVISGKESFKSDTPPKFSVRIGRMIAYLWERKTGYACDLKLVYYSAEYGTMRFESSSKFCMIKGEPHTGNHVWFRAYLRTCKFLQGCYSEKGTCTTSDGERNTTERMDLDLPEDLALEVKRHQGGDGRRSGANPAALGLVNLMEYHMLLKECDKKLHLSS